LVLSGRRQPVRSGTWFGFIFPDKNHYETRELREIKMGRETRHPDLLSFSIFVPSACFVVHSSPDVDHPFIVHPERQPSCAEEAAPGAGSEVACEAWFDVLFLMI
jgi:hypothetical protein